VIDLSGQHILIIGGSRGIGRATALMAAQAGANVSIHYTRDQSAAADIARQIRALGRKSVEVCADVCDEKAVLAATEKAVEALGPLTGLVVSAGIFEPAPIEQMTTEFWDRMLDINLRGTFLSVRAAIPSLRSSQGGSIVILTSTAGQRGSSVYSAYATSKGGQILFMRSMAQELAKDRIRVNCIAPGWTLTDMSRDTMQKIGMDDILRNAPLGRIGRPEDPAGAACFLLSGLAEYITGSTITVDGGMDMRG
jgi:NAD(P)-dependent dehydrogenase (short-subunit alcohol dehydrogenase family)